MHVCIFNTYFFSQKGFLRYKLYEENKMGKSRLIKFLPEKEIWNITQFRTKLNKSNLENVSASPERALRYVYRNCIPPMGVILSLS